MKVTLTNLALFVLFALVFSSLSGCTGTTANSDQTASDQAATNADSSAQPKKKSQYPPLVSAVANADLKNLDGSTFKVTDKVGKVLILNMWATWCGPCRQEMPALVRMQETFGEKLEVIGLNTDKESVEEINKFAEDMKLNYTLVWADTNTQNELVKVSKFGGIPQSFIIDQEGNLRGVFRGAAPADVKKMEELVALVVAGGETAAPATPAEAGSVPAPASVGLDAGDASAPVEKKPSKK